MRGELACGPAAVADRMLLGGRQLGHRPLVVRPGVVRDEGRVVAEPSGAAGLAGQRPLAATLEHRFRAILIDERDRADVCPPPVVLLPHLTQELLQVLLVARLLAGIPRRAHPGSAAQPVGLDAGVVGGGPPSRRGVGGPSLAERVLLERLTGLRGQLDLRRQEVYPDAGQRLAELAELVVVSR